MDLKCDRSYGSCQSSDLESEQQENFHVQRSSESYKERSCCSILASGKLFSCLTKATGLWNPRKRRYAILCGVFVLLNISSLVAEIVIPSICGPYLGRCVTQKSHVTNTTNDRSESKSPKMYGIIYGFVAWNAFSDVMTYILLIYTLWRVQRQMPFLCPASAEAKVSSCEWLFINVMFILCSVAITVATSLRVSISKSGKMKFDSTFGLTVLIVYLTALICSCMFAVLTCALRSTVDVSFQEICSMSHASLNDIIAVHRKLNGQIVTASHILTPWFLVHWLMFGAYCFGVFAFDSLQFQVLTHKFSSAHLTFQSVTFFLNFALFLVPCVFASRVTWRCEDILFKLNNMSPREWNEGHPFHERANVNTFLFYAERSRCGFRIRNLTFGSSGTWISVILGLLSLGIRIIQYIT